MNIWSILTYDDTGQYFNLITPLIKASDYALNGIFYLNSSNVSSADSTFTNLITFISPSFVTGSNNILQYLYTNLSETYELSLTLIFFSVYRESSLTLNVANVKSALQHIVSLRSILISKQKSFVTSYSSGQAVNTGWLNADNIIAFRETALAIIALGTFHF